MQHNTLYSLPAELGNNWPQRPAGLMALGRWGPLTSCQTVQTHRRTNTVIGQHALKTSLTLYSSQINKHWLKADLNKEQGKSHNMPDHDCARMRSTPVSQWTCTVIRHVAGKASWIHRLHSVIKDKENKENTLSSRTRKTRETLES